MALRRWVIAASLCAGLWASAAAACPACAGRDNDNPNRTAWLLGAMILLPWTVAGAVVVALRKLQETSPEGEPPPEPIHHGDGNEP
ncbi:MAG TPA: hypothetical protein VFB81_14495 [Myxococcales bacterium]|nr:hypothetical protein [Myxococcales bacterium]